MRSKPADVKTFVNDSLLEPHGAICKHLRDSERALLVSFKLAILSIFNDVYVIVNLVIMGNSLGVFPDVIVFNTLLFLSLHLLVVGLELQVQ